MKGPKFKLFLLSIILLTISSALMFSKTLFQIDAQMNNSRVDIEEIINLNGQITSEFLGIHKSSYSEFSNIDQELNKFYELNNLLKLNMTTNTFINTTIKKSYERLSEKIINLRKLKNQMILVRESLSKLNTMLNEIQRNKIVFILDNKDFYTQSSLNILLYNSNPIKINDERAKEDLKILDQIIGYSKTPNILIVRYKNLLTSIYQDTAFIDQALTKLKLENQSLDANQDLISIKKYYNEISEQRNQSEKLYLSMVFISLTMYLITLFLQVSSLRKS